MLNATPKKDNIALTIEHHQGAENGTRTRDPDLGKVVLYQLSYFRVIPLVRSISLDCGCKGNTFF